MVAYEKLNAYFGDIHNHCAVGYGHGSLDNAFRNARMQLDFAAVTVHAHWPDIPIDDARLANVVEYHQQGFRITDAAWAQVQETVAENYQPDEFVTFLAFEWHSREYGDHCVYYNGSEGEILRAVDLADMRQRLRQLQNEGVEALVIPHHIGYKQGYRGINWDAFSPEFSPVAEIMSMHGASESADAPYPYLHTMGPRDWSSTLQCGLAAGNVVGVVGSTDHHSAHPGSYGHGRMGVWAEELSRDAVWAAIKARRTYALTGDNIELAFSVNGKVMGAIAAPASERQIEVAVNGGSALDYVEILHNNRIIHRANAFESLIPEQSEPFVAPFKIHMEVGWGETGENVDWQVELEVVNGQLIDVEPRFRGHSIVAPQAGEEESYAFSDWERSGTQGVRFATRTWGNPTTTTANTQGMNLEIIGDAGTLIRGRVNGEPVEVALADLIVGPRAGYLGGFLTPAYTFHRAIPQREFVNKIDFTHSVNATTRDWYHVRVRQVNGQWAWSSPIWVEA